MDENKDYENDLNDVAAFLYENKGKGPDGNYVFEEVNVSDNDTVGQSFSQPELRKYTKNYLDGYFAVPKVM